jgi:hypothetical protein
MEVGEQKQCRGCGERFVIHVRCDRGREYCGEACRAKAHEEVRRRARAKHQKSPLGRLDHRDRMRALRAARSARVMDVRSENLAPPPAWCRGRAGPARGGREPESGRPGHEWIESR